MIRTDAEYAAARERMEEQSQRLRNYEAQLKTKGLDGERIKRALDPIRSMHAQMVEELGAYERLSKGQFDDLINLRGLGYQLVGLRIAHGLTQRELASRLGVHESQVSRDERNEYHGITIERAARVLDAIGAILRTTTTPSQPSVSCQLQRVPESDAMAEPLAA